MHNRTSGNRIVEKRRKKRANPQSNGLFGNVFRGDDGDRRDRPMEQDIPEPEAVQEPLRSLSPRTVELPGTSGHGAVCAAKNPRYGPEGRQT